MIPTPLDAVVFDMDGLLLDSESLYRVALFETCAGLGYTMTDPLHLSLIGSPHDESSQKLLNHFGADFPLEACHERTRAAFGLLSRDGMPLRPGALSLLEFLKAEAIPTGLATSTRREPALAHLKRAGLLDLLDAVVTRSDVALGKPHPETYLKAAASLGVDPRRCLALEDSYKGVRSASSAGMATIMIPDLLPPTDEMRSLCVAIIDSLESVQEKLRDRISQNLVAA